MQNQPSRPEWVFVVVALVISSLIFFAGMAFYVIVIAPPR